VSNAPAAPGPVAQPPSLGSSLRDLLRFLARNVLVSLSLVLLGASTFFFISAEGFRRSIRRRQTEGFRTGDLVRVTRVIDGDELVVVDARNRQTVVRLLGVKSFDPTRNDPLLKQYGTICVDHIKSQFVGKDARLTVGEPRTDRHGRLLAYLAVTVDGSDLDVGLDLVRRGLSLVYNRYEFSRMDSYARAEIEAMNAKAGLWSNAGVASRAQALKAVWDERRAEAAQ
jgi:endonuclease YncB( thermonuclease family)